MNSKGFNSLPIKRGFPKGRHLPGIPQVEFPWGVPPAKFRANGTLSNLPKGEHLAAGLS